jgi:hypothetical protein
MTLDSRGHRTGRLSPAAVNARYTKLVRYIAMVFAKSFFLAKISYTYTMNYLR